LITFGKNIGLKNLFEIETELAKGRVVSMIKPNYQIFIPACKSDFQTQWNSCFENFQDYMKAKLIYKPFVVHVFVSSDNIDEYQHRLKLIKQSLTTSGRFPVGVLSQSPEKALFGID